MLEGWIRIDDASNSDIDWSQSIVELDAQLYRKYGLSDDEIKVK